MRMLNSKIRADFPFVMETNIEMQIIMQSMFMTYTSNISNYSKTFYQRHHNSNITNNTCKRIQTLAGCGEKGICGGICSGRGVKRVRGHISRNPNAHRNYGWQVTGIDGKMIKVHP